MENQQQNNQSYNILCDKVFYERLRYVEQNQWIKIFMFPVKNTTTKSLNLVIFDLFKSKPSSDLKQFKYEDFYSTCQSIIEGISTPQVLIYLINKQQIQQLLNDESKKIRISCPQQARQLNQSIKECVIVTLTLPSGFYQYNDCNFNLQGYKFNPIGKIRQGWSYLSNGRVMKAIFAKQNQKVKNLLQQNTTYPKNQVKKILETIQSVNNLTSNQQNKSEVVQQLRVLGQNYCHSDKFITNSNGLIPILNFEIEILCSMTRGQSCKNKISKQTSNSSPKVSHNVCINFSEGIQLCQNLINKKVQQIFTGDKTVLSKKSQESLILTNMPTKISNPHLFLKTEFKEKFQQFYVKGFYEYFHYGDHNFNDQGWGCAYRSLQTLLSWFRLQQKLNLLTIPTVPEIQNLIDIIDCTSQQKLSNTNTWIGATEVSWVVKKLTGFDCRIIHIQDGKDIVEHAQIFRDHLQNVGTPIMYGGGEYAYSIVGINYSWKLGEIMFLILDPHYNGSDKIQKIIEKKGICWRKPQEMFKKGVFYNFCLPIL